MELPSYFTQYLRKIQPSRTSRESAIQLHTTLRGRLASTDNEPLSKWYSDSFLYGSYIRNTAIHPIKDVDVCLLLNLAIDEFTPETVVRRLKNVLEELGYEDKTAYQRRSIRIDMSGTTLDAVPVVPIEGEEEVLHIPDRKLKEWIHTHPKAHMEAATRINKESGGRYIPLVKIVKAWYCYQAKEKRSIERPKPKGFTLEMLVANYQDPDAPTYAEAFIYFLQNLIDVCGASLKAGTFPQVPDLGLPGEFLKVTFEEDEAKLFAEIVEESLTIAKRALAAETYGESALLWRDVFGNRFPDAPAATKALRASELVETDETIFDPEFEAEISDVGLLTPTLLNCKVKLSAQLAVQKYGRLLQHYPTGSRAIAKGMWIKFSIVSTNVQPPYEIRWIVENHGKEAKEANQMRHHSVTDWIQPHNWEHTQYRGTHYLICEIIKNEKTVARAKHTVNIK